jgi:hypothetical protein
MLYIERERKREKEREREREREIVDAYYMHVVSQVPGIYMHTHVDSLSTSTGGSNL